MSEAELTGVLDFLLQGGPLPEERARRIFQQLIVAIDFCHRLGIANRDIKVRIPSFCHLVAASSELICSRTS